jgi:membrane-associated phospholipid phosphatase
MAGSKKGGAKAPVKGLLLLEWVMLGYALGTLLLMFFMQTKMENTSSIIILRVQSVAIVLALWGVYRMMPCRLTLAARVLAQLAMLCQWYPETFDFNRYLTNLDPLFAGWEQQLFGCQPALLFSQKYPSPFVSEALTMGYVSYYPMMVAVPLFYLFFRYNEFLKTSFILLSSFFLFYVIFLFLPVAGPQYYYLAAGIDNIAQGVFPDIGNYFETHSEALSSPGYADGVFYKILVWFHEAGERPTAAFPSSHVGVTTVLLWLAWASKNRWLFWTLLPFGVLMFFATFYIQAHYAIDAIAGLFTGTFMYFLFLGLYKVLSGKNRV